VDHGKTSLLDALRKTRITEKEAGKITQGISSWEIPIGMIESACGALMNKMKTKFSIPGLLFIDTPGHEAFVNLRKRGGSIADIAILVIDVNQGLQPQTKEAIEILREYKTPFVVAFTKIDTMQGWVENRPKNTCFTDVLQTQREDVRDDLDKKIYELVGNLSQYGFSCERFDRVDDFTQQIAIIPTSSETREGLAELLLFVAGLAQKFMEKKLEKGPGPGKASILELKEERGIGKTLDVIVYEGTIREGEDIVFSQADGTPIRSRVKALLKPKPLDQRTNPEEKFTTVKSVEAAAGVKIACENADHAVAGSSVFVVNDQTASQMEDELRKEAKEIEVETNENGVIVNADALGSLEAIVRMLKHENIPIRHARVGKIVKKDVLEAASVAKGNQFLGVVFGFNTSMEDDARQTAKEEHVKLFEEKVIYYLIENYKQWKQEEKEAERKKAFQTIPLPARIQVLENHCFRVSSPCIFGVEVLVGRIRKGTRLMTESGVSIGEIKSIQKEKESVDEAKRGDSVAIAVQGPYFGRQVKEKFVLYTEIDRNNVKTLEEKYGQALSDEEKELLQVIKKIRGFTVIRSTK